MQAAQRQSAAASGTALIRRSSPADKFVLIANAVTRDAELSYGARGVLAELLSHSPGWRVSADEMGRDNMRLRGHEGERVMRRYFRELRAAGYLHRVVTRVERGRFCTELHLYGERTTCAEGDCQDCARPDPAGDWDAADCTAAAHCTPGDVSAGRTDATFTDGRTASRPIEDSPTEDEELDRRVIVGPRAAATAPDPALTRKDDLRAVTAAAWKRLHVAIDPDDRTASYLLRTLRRSGARTITSVAAYADRAFTAEPDKWRTLAVRASDGDGHVDDDEAWDILAAGGARARGEDYDAWTTDHCRDKQGRLAGLELRD